MKDEWSEWWVCEALSVVLTTVFYGCVHTDLHDLKQWSHFCIFSFHFAFPGRDLSVGSAYNHSIRYSLTTGLIYSWAFSKRMESTLAVLLLFFFYLLTPPAATKFTKDMLLPSLMENVWSPLYLTFLKNLTLRAKSDCLSVGFQDISFSWFPSPVQPPLLSGIQTLGSALFIPHPTL